MKRRNRKIRPATLKAMARNDAFTAALGLLKTRERSEKELELRLQRKGFDRDAIEAVIIRCRELNYLDDGRFARCRARQMLLNGRAVGIRLRRELLAAGIAEQLAEQVIGELQEEFIEEALLAEGLERRFPGFDYQQADDRQKRRVVHYFLRRGFPLGTIMNQLKQQT